MVPRPDAGASSKRPVVCARVPASASRLAGTRTVSRPRWLLKRACALLRRPDMKDVSRSTHQIATLARRMFSRTVAVIIGFALMAVGLGMTATIVLLPAGIVIGVLGVAVLIGAFLAPDIRSEQQGGH